ncbi:MAG: efflux RND transporter periplasmic adaptor subunit [Alphaproteobacteria bacterium]|jgi:RND family efflux transporter MFP subunit|nr:efflux RND transporter periplasmic adaptor subunit [Alphaproteobacteria bacterium]
MMKAALPYCLSAAFAVFSLPAWAEMVAQPVMVDDLKAVFGQVTSVDQTRARTRIAGTLQELSVDEGDLVWKDQVLAVVVDEKLRLQAAALAARLKSVNARRALAQTSLKRAGDLRRKGAISQARMDEAQTDLDVLQQEVSALRAEQELIKQRGKEGAVLAPAGGRILRVAKTRGSVVVPGEDIALIAANNYVLRLRLPERHAKFIRAGDPVQIGARGLAKTPDAGRSGKIKQIYPEIQDGRVVADVNVPDLGDFFVGERVRVWLSAGRRQTYLVPKDYLSMRMGISTIRLADGVEVVVQPGLQRGRQIEILSGLRPGDRLVRP